MAEQLCSKERMYRLLNILKSDTLTDGQTDVREVIPLCQHAYDGNTLTVHTIDQQCKWKKRKESIKR